MIYLIAFLAPLFYALSVLIESFLSLDVFKRPSTMCFFVSLTNSLFVPLALFLGTPNIPDFFGLFIYTVLAFIDIAYLYPYYIALKKTDTSVVSSLFTIGKIFVPLLAYIILDDVLSPIQYLGFFIIISAALILNIRQKCCLTLNAAFYLMLLSSFLLSCRLILAKYILQAGTPWVNTIIYPNLISGVLVFLFLLLPKLRQDIRRKVPTYLSKIRLFVLIEFITFLAVTSSVYALSRLSPVVSSAIEATEPLFLLGFASLSSLFLPYQFQEFKVPFFKKILCFLLMILGIIFVP